jgi:hypothetical protein
MLVGVSCQKNTSLNEIMDQAPIDRSALIVSFCLQYFACPINDWSAANFEVQTDSADFPSWHEPLLESSGRALGVQVNE